MVVSAMQNRAYNTKQLKTVLLCFGIALFLLILYPGGNDQQGITLSITPFSPRNIISNKIKEESESSEVIAVRNALQPFWECLRTEVKSRNNDFIKMWNDFTVYSKICTEKTDAKKIKLESIRNKDEMKFYIYPDPKYNNTKEGCIIVTLGVGTDTTAEETIKKKLPANSEFYGADPIIEQNADLYNSIGIFFPLAVGQYTGRSIATVRMPNGAYRGVTMTHIDIATFITKMVNRTRIDHLFMDNEGPEYDLLPLMENGKLFDDLGITVCHMNVELHALAADSPNRNRFVSIIDNISKDSRYAPLLVQSAGHQRAFFVNTKHPYCINKYLKQFF